MAAQDAKAVELRLAGLSYPTIAAQLGYPTPGDAAAAVRHSLQDVPEETPELIRRQEVERLDAMLTGLWPKARRGDAVAVDRVMRLTERRSRLMGLTGDGVGALRTAFDASVETSTLVDPIDVALVEAGRKIADRVDEATTTGEGQEITKALYLVPHMVNILREMLATPASRAAAGLIAKESTGGKLAGLRSIEGGRTNRPA